MDKSALIDLKMVSSGGFLTVSDTSMGRLLAKVSEDVSAGLVSAENAKLSLSWVDFAEPFPVRESVDWRSAGEPEEFLGWSNPAFEIVRTGNLELVNVFAEEIVKSGLSPASLPKDAGVPLAHPVGVAFGVGAHHLLSPMFAAAKSLGWTYHSPGAYSSLFSFGETPQEKSYNSFMDSSLPLRMLALNNKVGLVALRKCLDLLDEVLDGKSEFAIKENLNDAIEAKNLNFVIAAAERDVFPENLFLCGIRKIGRRGTVKRLLSCSSKGREDDLIKSFAEQVEAHMSHVLNWGHSSAENAYVSAAEELLDLMSFSPSARASFARHFTPETSSFMSTLGKSRELLNETVSVFGESASVAAARKVMKTFFSHPETPSALRARLLIEFLHGKNAVDLEDIRPLASCRYGLATAREEFSHPASSKRISQGFVRKLESMGVFSANSIRSLAFRSDMSPQERSDAEKELLSQELSIEGRALRQSV